MCHERARGARVNGGGNQAPFREWFEEDKRVSVEKVSMVYDCSTDIQDLEKKKKEMRRERESSSCI